MSLFRDLPSRNLNILSSPPDTATTASSMARTSSSSSRNDLFTTSWQPEIPPPRPLTHDIPSTTATDGREEEPTTDPLHLLSSAKISSNGVHANTMPLPMKRRDFSRYDANHTTRHSVTSSPAESGRNSPMLVDEFGVPKRGHVPSSVTAPTHQRPHSQTTNPNARQGSPRTSSFFDVVLSTDLPAPPPAPPRATPTLHSMHASSGNNSPNNLSRSTSLRRAPPPPLLPLSRTGSNNYNINGGGGSDRQRSWESYTSSIPSSPSASASYATAEEDPLSPLHQSPQLPPSRAGQADWIPPLPPAADDIELRLVPNSTYLLGEGRYAKVYLAAYKRTKKLKVRGKEELLGRIPPFGHSSFTPAPVRGEDKAGAEEKKEVNEDGDGLVGGDWKLCAVKRLAPDRESQTMGLREAFFLNRLMATSSLSGDSRPVDFPKSGRTRAVSPLRDSFGQTPRQTMKHASRRRSRNGSVYITKLIAVKEDVEGLPHSAHVRSTSDAIKSQKTKASNGTLTRQRSSTMLPPHSPTTAPVNRVAAKVSVGCSQPDITKISSFPSFPSLAQAIRQEYSAPSLSRLVLVLEHAPLGTLDRLLRTSPQLVGKKLWGRWAREGVEALEWVHGKGVVHADIKPGNLLVRGNMFFFSSFMHAADTCFHSSPPTSTSVSQTLARHSSFIHFIHLQMVSA